MHILASKISYMNKTIEMMHSVLAQWLSAGHVPEVDWKSRVKTLEFQEMVRARDLLIESLGSFTCTGCPDFAEHVSTGIWEWGNGANYEAIP